jgi:putative glycosyl hydrolase
MSASRKARLALSAAALAAIASALAPGQARPAVAAVTSHHERANFKKGVGAWPFPKSRRALAKSGVSWYYTWAVNHPGITTARGVRFVPMIWGAHYVTRQNLKLVEQQGHTLLTFNEPDLSSQSNMTVAQALRLWPRLEATKMRLSSPAVAFDAATPGSWLARFMSQAANRHYRVNFIALHWYGADFSTEAAVRKLRTYLSAVWNRYHKPIWLTEFALWKFDPSVFPSPRGQAAFVSAATTMLRRLPYVWRYAWFALPADGADGTAGLFRAGAWPTAAGRAYEKVP